jgi:hypothetical protein
LRLAITAGLRVLVCENMAFSGDFTAVLAKHSKRFSLEDSLAVGVDRMQRNFEPMRRQVELWRQQQLSTATAKLIIYRAFIEGELDAPRHLAGVVHDLYFNPWYEEFRRGVERVHVAVQGARSHPAIQSDGEIGFVSRGSSVSAAIAGAGDSPTRLPGGRVAPRTHKRSQADDLFGVSVLRHAPA